MLSTPEGLRERLRAFLAEHDPRDVPGQDCLNARFDAGLAWAHYPEGLGGLALSRLLQQRWLRERWTGREIWRQLSSELGAGSDLAAPGTRALEQPDQT